MILFNTLGQIADHTTKFIETKVNVLNDPFYSSIPKLNRIRHCIELGVYFNKHCPFLKEKKNQSKQIQKLD